MRKLFICSNKKQFLTRPGYDNFLLFPEGTRPAISPAAIAKIKEKAKEEPTIFVSRSKLCNSILEAANVPYELLIL